MWFTKASMCHCNPQLKHTRILMSEMNTELVSLVKGLSDKFNSLQKDVDILKNKTRESHLTVTQTPRMTLSRQVTQPQSSSKGH